MYDVVNAHTVEVSEGALSFFDAKKSLVALFPAGK